MTDYTQKATQNQETQTIECDDLFKPKEKVYEKVENLKRCELIRIVRIIKWRSSCRQELDFCFLEGE